MDWMRWLDRLRAVGMTDEEIENQLAIIEARRLGPAEIKATADRWKRAFAILREDAAKRAQA